MRESLDAGALRRHAGRLILPARARRPGPGIWLAIALIAAPARAVTVDDPACEPSWVVVQHDTPVYRLPYGFLAAGTDTVRLHGQILKRDADYQLDALRGELRLLRVVPAGDTLEVRACRLLAPPPTDVRVMSYQPRGADPPDSAKGDAGGVAARPATAHDPAAPASGASLVVSGNKTLAVDFGSSQDATLRQSLDLTVGGTLAPGVTLTGVLSDRNLPLTTAGTTQGLQSFDRVLIELTAPQGSAALGDVALSLQHGEFARLERRVQGVRGEVGLGAFRGQVAAANAQGEYHRLEFFGIDGRQGPYELTDAAGATAIAVVAGSEVVMVDGVRLSRGEGADYSIDYERGRITFSNKHAISAESRITVDYQFTATAYRRNLAAAAGAWQWRNGYLFTQAVTESDDRGHPLDITLSESDRETLVMAGDSASAAVTGGVTYGVGDYDSVRVAGALAFVYAGPDSGHFSLQFTRVTPGTGDYADSALVAGVTIYNYAGPGHGTFRIGRQLPLPESQAVWSAGGGVHAGPLALEVEGAASHHDLNTFSSLDDGGNVGQAGRASLSLEGATPGPLFARAGFSVQARAVSERFAPFTRLEAPFAAEDWGLPIGADLEHQQRVVATAFVRPRFGGQLSAGVGRLRTPGGFESSRGTAEWTEDGVLSTHALWEHAAGTLSGKLHPDGGRDHERGDLRLRLRWLEPALRLESDERRVPSDSLLDGQRFREAALDLLSPRALAWHAAAGASRRLDQRLSAGGAFVDHSDSRTLRLGLDSPAGGRLGVGLAFQTREVTTLDAPGLGPGAAAPRARSDLGSIHLRGEDRGRGLRGTAGIELTSEGDNRSLRTLVFVGAGHGNYDAGGNYVPNGDYDLRTTVSPDLERLSRSATSARAEWTAVPARWGGTRASFDYETEARRRGDPEPRDPILSPGAALTDPQLARGAVLQRLETELLPESPAAALRLRLERHVTADRGDQNYVSTLDERLASARWRGRGGAAISAEIEGRWSQRIATQTFAAASGYARTLLEQGTTAQLIATPSPRLRAVAALDAGFSRPEGQREFTRTVSLGPDLGVALGARGHADVSARRAFISGPPPLSLLPTLDPVGAPTWLVRARFDYRVHETTTFSLSADESQRPGVPALVTGRAELRAFF